MKALVGIRVVDFIDASIHQVCAFTNRAVRSKRPGTLAPAGSAAASTVAPAHRALENAGSVCHD